MSANRNHNAGAPAACHILAVLVCLCTFAYPQAEQPLTWLQDLTALQNATSTGSPEQRATVMQVRADAENWIKLHPDSTIKLPAAPTELWSAEQTQNQIAILRETVEKILQQDPDHPFHLGVAEVNVSVSVSPLSPVVDTISQTEIKSIDAVNLAQAANYLPGVSLEHYSSRNQDGIYVRGFGTREVPLYVDGIPIYMPYDGQIDFNRFLTSEISEVQVAKGYTSSLTGPNSMGGAVNMVTREPVNKLEDEALIGSHSGGGLDGGLRLASRWQRFFLQGSLDWTQSNYTPLPHDFQVNAYQPTDARVNSDNRDQRYSGRVGWTPRGQDEYVFSYINQKANYGDPPYAGIYPVCTSGQSNAGGTPCDNAKYWKWPVWDKESYYLLSNTGIGETGSLKLRAYYDHYPTQANEYDNETYSSMTSPNNTGVVEYNDHTDGGSAVFSSRILPRNIFGTSLVLQGRYPQGRRRFRRRPCHLPNHSSYCRCRRRRWRRRWRWRRWRWRWRWWWRHGHNYEQQRSALAGRPRPDMVLGASGHHHNFFPVADHRRIQPGSPAWATGAEL